MSAENRQEAQEKGYVARTTEAPALPDEFYRTMTAHLARIAENAGVPRDQCEDLAQEAWLRALKHKEQFRGEHALD